MGSKYRSFDSCWVRVARIVVLHEVRTVVILHEVRTRSRFHAVMQAGPVFQAAGSQAFTRIQRSDRPGKDTVLRCQPSASVEYPDIVPRWSRFGIRRIDRSQSIDTGRWS